MRGPFRIEVGQYYTHTLKYPHTHTLVGTIYALISCAPDRNVAHDGGPFMAGTHRHLRPVISATFNEILLHLGTSTHAPQKQWLAQVLRCAGRRMYIHGKP